MVEPKKLVRKDLDKIMRVMDKRPKEIQWHTSRLFIRPLLPFDEYMALVQNILDDCRNEDMAVLPELLDFSMRVRIISAYSYVELPEDVGELYQLVYSTDLYDVICREVNTAQLESVKWAVKG